MEKFYWAARKHIPTGSWDEKLGIQRVLILCMALELIRIKDQSPLDFYINGIKEFSEE